MTLVTGHKAFDKQSSGFFTGNHSGNTVFSSYIRAETNTECDRHQFDVGHLRSFDLSLFKQFAGFPIVVQNWLKEHPDVDTILYCLFHKVNSKRVIDGWILTGTDHKVVCYCNSLARKIMDGVIY